MNHFRRALLAITATLLLSSHAHAYLDPGTGSAIVQGVLAAFAALAVTAKLYWHRLLKLLGLRKSEKKTDNAEGSSPAEGSLPAEGSPDNKHGN